MTINPTSGRNWRASREQQKKFGAKSFSIWNRTFLFFTIGMNFFFLTNFRSSVLLAVKRQKNIVFAHVKFVKWAFLRFQNFVCNKLSWRNLYGEKNISALRRIEDMKCLMRTRVTENRNKFFQYERWSRKISSAEFNEEPCEWKPLIAVFGFSLRLTVFNFGRTSFHYYLRSCEC